jgi:DNA recombination-dependent growth factor C
MGLLSGGPNGRRFRVTSELPPGFRDTFLESVREHAFVEDDGAADGEARLGWVDLFDPAVTTFELNNLLYDQLLALSLRADTKKIQGAYFQIAKARRLAEIAALRGVEKLSKAEAEEVTDALETELLKRALPSVATTEVVWDLGRNVLWVFATSEGPLEHVRQLVKETFGVSMAPERTVDWLTDRLTLDEVRSRATTWLGGAGTSDDPLEAVAFPLATDFLTWLWLQSETTDGLFRVLENADLPSTARDADGEEVELTERLKHADLTLWLDDRMTLRELTREQPETMILSGEAPSATPEARRGLQGGKRPVDVKIGLRLNELECVLGLQATPEGLRIASPKIPFVVKNGREERLFERIALLDLLHTTVAHLFRQFFLDRTSEAWEERLRPFLGDAEQAAAK